MALSGRTRPDHGVPEAYARASMRLFVVWFSVSNMSSLRSDLLGAWESRALPLAFPISVVSRRLALQMISMIETSLERARRNDT